MNRRSDLYSFWYTVNGLFRIFEALEAFNIPSFYLYTGISDTELGIVLGIEGKFLYNLIEVVECGS